MTIEPQRRNTVRGRPKVADGTMDCARCQRTIRKSAATWPDGKICNSCYYAATSLYGDCASCGIHRLLPGRLDIGDQPVCRDCARIRQSFHCASCNDERRLYRRDVCARCCLRNDLTSAFAGHDSPAGFSQLIAALCTADRAESIITWKRSEKVQQLLRSLGDGTTPLTHEGLDQFEPQGRHVEHLRAILQHHEVLPCRDKYVAYFEKWIDDKLASVSDPEISQPIKPWLFPGYRPGEHLHPNTVMDRLRQLGIDLLGARNTALQELVSEVPTPVVAEMLGYSDQVVHRHAALASQPWAKYRVSGTG